MIETTLKELGMSDKEIAVYSTVLEYGKVSPARIANLTRINRTTVYAVGKDLVQKGYLNEDALKGVTYYYPAAPKDLVKIAKRERQSLIQKELTLEELAREIKEMPQSKTYAVPRVRFVEGEEKVAQYLYDSSPRWLNGYETRPLTWYGIQDHTFVGFESYLKWIDWYWKDAPQSVDLKLLTNNSQEEQAMQERKYPRRHIKFWTGSAGFTVTQWIIGDYSVMIQTKENPHYLVEMHDAVYANNMRELFKNLWEEVT